MHISDGILSGEVCAATAGAAIPILLYTLKKTRQDRIPAIAVMTAAFFTISLIHVKLGPVSTHPVLNGLMGIVLGLSSFPAIVAALLLQAVMFQHGGITTLGANSLTMGGPALMAWGAFRFFSARFPDRKRLLSITAGLIGLLSLLISGLLVALLLTMTGKAFTAIAWLIISIHLPIAAGEGILTAFIVSFLYKVKPEILNGKS